MPTLTPEQIEKRAKWRADQKIINDFRKAHAKALRDARKAKQADEAAAAALPLLRAAFEGYERPARGYELVFTEVSASRDRLSVRMSVRFSVIDLTDLLAAALKWPTFKGYLVQTGVGTDPANSVTYAASVALYGEPYKLRYRWER